MTANRRMNYIETLLSTDTEKAIESACINGVSVLSGLNLEKFPTPETIEEWVQAFGATISGMGEQALLLVGGW